MVDYNIARDIVVGLFRLAGIEEDEDLLFACVSDVRYITSILVIIGKYRKVMVNSIHICERSCHVM